MTAAIRNRIRRLEVAVLPPPPKVFKLLAAPLPGAAAEAVKAFEQELKQLQGTCDLVIVLRPLERLPRRGVEYCETEAEAQIKAAAHTPSASGYGTLLDDALGSLSGAVVAPQSENMWTTRRLAHS